MAPSHKEAAVDFLKLVASGKTQEAYQKYVGAIRLRFSRMCDRKQKIEAVLLCISRRMKMACSEAKADYALER